MSISIANQHRRINIKEYNLRCWFLSPYSKLYYFIDPYQCHDHLRDLEVVWVDKVVSKVFLGFAKTCLKKILDRHPNSHTSQPNGVLFRTRCRSKFGLVPSRPYLWSLLLLQQGMLPSIYFFMWIEFSGLIESKIDNPGWLSCQDPVIVWVTTTTGMNFQLVILVDPSEFIPSHSAKMSESDLRISRVLGKPIPCKSFHGLLMGHGEKI